jgi:arylsulfatase A-like enzyme
MATDRGNPGPDRLSARQVLLLGAWLAITAGLAEGLAHLVLGRRVHGFVYLGPDVYWMAPVANLVWLALPTTILALGARLLPGGLSRRTAVTLLGGMAWVAVMLLVPRLHHGSAILLGIGLGTVSARLTAREPPTGWRWSRAGLLWSVAGLLVLASGPRLVRRLREASAPPLPPAPAPGAPNILLIIWDTVRRSSLGVYGAARPTTPELGQRRGQLLMFTHAFAASSWTLPSHASFFTGALPHQLSTGWTQPLDRARPVIAEWMRDQGFETAGFVANVLYCNRSYGLGRGFAHYEDYRLTPGAFVENSAIGRAFITSALLRRLVGYWQIPGRSDAGRITDAFLRWEAARDRGRPFFAFLNLFDAHKPYLPPPEFARRFSSGGPRRTDLYTSLPQLGGFVADANRRMSRADMAVEEEAYDGAILYLDHQLDRLLDELGRRGVLQNTVVIVTADHGESFLEHGAIGHGKNLYRETTEVPLLILDGRGSIPPGEVAEPVTLADLPATLVTLSGSRAASPFPGGSLISAEGTAAASGSPVISELRKVDDTTWTHAIVSHGYRAIWDRDSVFLFRLDWDPGETMNLASSPENGPVLARLREELGAAVGPMAGRLQ